MYGPHRRDVSVAVWASLLSEKFGKQQISFSTSERTANILITNPDDQPAKPAERNSPPKILSRDAREMTPMNQAPRNVPA
jgi:hypothetical protein